MSFKIDKQTLEELNLLGKFRQGSVYHLFNKVKTRGGEKLLDDMFHHPLLEETAINKRSAVFRFFQESKLQFPFDVMQINQMREYLDGGAKKNAAMALADVFIKKILSNLTRDERFRKIVQGLQATIVTLKKTAVFLETIQGANNVFEDRIKAAKSVLSSKQIEKLLNIDIYQDLPVSTIANFDHLLKNRLAKEMQEIMQFIYEVDLNIAVGNVAEVRGFTYAKALPAERNLLSAANLSHPCLDGAVGNNIRMSGTRNVIFLTGANMAGKSTLMKSVGIVLYLAHMGFPVSAAEVEFSVREGMYTSINVADNIGLGYSHFYAEVVRVKQAAEAAATGGRLLLMFDELFKGTNVKDAYDGTLAVTKAFADYTECLFVVSTHIIEVGEALEGSSNIRFTYMPTVMEGSRPRYTYKLQEGITEDRQGMMIIRNEGILELLQ
ncbi:MutS-related protein [Pseudobacter ginsenosidimutans]|uniref:MutS-like protein n=1 Tax=Pseudobacter ginsenosidimutans TaxID=661488 RepID=A0A4V2F0B1_9BACT|nr:DNA mismatch repair protein [Pseudobacter ginsenosidimutans]QEC45693.1 DNA mismatch repair protein [Pseudobacter ginsenosidimutans]RZS69370.1 MutS-like protein [Pseudobacter ginsenosidimutans]